MFGRRSPQAPPAEGTGRHGRGRARRLIPGVLILVVACTSAGVALAGSITTVVRPAPNKALGQTITVDSRGRTIYVLSPETTRHLLCKSRECLGLWPPVTVRSRSAKLRAGAGIHGRLGLLRRSNGALQVTLSGRPLYRYSGDSARGEANGVGIKSFGGTWHALGASGSPSTPPAAPGSPPMTTTAPAPAPPAYPY
jgi:predicted lipoprotein with Yx(FWY)xxD motif